MIKISPEDQIQALKRSSMYAKDYMAFSKEYKKQNHIDSIIGIPSLPSTKKKDVYFDISEPTKKLCKKYNLSYPIAPKSPFHESDLLRLRSPISFFYPREFGSELKKCLANKDKDLRVVGDKLLSYLDGRLTIMIDLNFPRDLIEKEFNKIMDDRSKPLSKRIKSNEVDIWEVYDMHKKENKNLLQIAVEKLNSGKQPGANTEDDRKLKIIKRAYEKACKIIEAIEKQSQNKK